jgi:tRNA1(Val) A37 N6-methylase TrmN6
MQNEVEVSLDSKTRMLGVVYTPVEIANSITQLTLSKCKKKVLHILEPSVGDGYFLQSIEKEITTKFEVTAVDIDGDVVDGLKERLDSLFLKKTNLINSDFIQYALSHELTKFDLIIGNPPFIRKHNYSTEFKKNLDLLSQKNAYPLKDLKNSWAAFIIAANSLLSNKGVMSFIVPYELMNVAYGQAIQKHIFPQFERVDVYIPDQKAFKDIDQDAVVFVAQKKSDEESGVFINRVDCLSRLSIISGQKGSYKSSANISLDLKAFLLDATTTELLHKLRKKCERIIDYCQSSPGIVTGANDFFILTTNDVQKYNLWPYAKKILKKGGFLPKSPIFTDDDFNNL